MISYADARTRLEDYRSRIGALRQEMRELQAAAAPEPVGDYLFQTLDGPVRLAELFGGKSDLIVIHNMGKACPSCTMWADGFNGVYDHLAARAAFVVSSPDAPEVQQAFAAGRGWRFPMVSHVGSTFAQDLGYRDRHDDAFDKSVGGWHPGVSAFRKEGDQIVRVADAELGPGDDFCVVWHLFDLLPAGGAGFRPRYKYARA